MREVSKAVSEDGPPETTERCAVRGVHDGGNFGSDTFRESGARSACPQDRRRSIAHVSIRPELRLRDISRAPAHRMTKGFAERDRSRGGAPVRTLFYTLRRPSRRRIRTRRHPYSYAGKRVRTAAWPKSKLALFGRSTVLRS